MFSTSFARPNPPRLPQKLAGVVGAIFLSGLALTGCARDRGEDRLSEFKLREQRSALAQQLAEHIQPTQAALPEEPPPPVSHARAADEPAAQGAQLAGAGEAAATGAAPVLRADLREIGAAVRQEMDAFRSAAVDIAHALASAPPPSAGAAELTTDATATTNATAADAHPALSLPVIALCTEVSRFGTYEPLSTRFDAGKRHRTLLYVEVDHFAAQQAQDRRWETKMRFSAVLTDARGNVVLGVPESPVIDRSRQRRRDFFVCCDLTLPGSLPPGRYLLAVTVADTLGGGVAQQTMELEVVGQE